MTREEHFAFLTKTYNPLAQAGVVFLAGLLVTFLSKLLNITGLLEVSDRFPWLTAAAFLLFFSLFNSITSLGVKDLNDYWTKSMIAFVGLAVFSGFCAYLFSDIAIGDAGSYRWIFIVLTLGYLIFLSMMGLIKRIVEFAEREDWQSPKKRKNGRK